MAQGENETADEALPETALEALPGAFEVTQNRRPDTGETDRRVLQVEHPDGAVFRVAGSEQTGFSVYHREPDADVFETVLRSRVHGRREFRSFDVCVDRMTVLAEQYDATHDAE
jgi:hypothetical protein